MTAEIRALRSTDDRQAFDSGDEALNFYFHRYAGQNQFRHHLGVSYVAADGARILAFVTVTPGLLDAADLPSGRRMPPYPLPILRIARLAVAQDQQGRGLGQALLRFCVELAEKMRDELGCVGLVVDSKARSVDFYRRYGFTELDPVEGASRGRPAPVMMFLSLGSVPRRR